MSRSKKPTQRGSSSSGRSLATFTRAASASGDPMPGSTKTCSFGARGYFTVSRLNAKSDSGLSMCVSSFRRCLSQSGIAFRLELPRPVQTYGYTCSTKKSSPTLQLQCVAGLTSKRRPAHTGQLFAGIAKTKTCWSLSPTLTANFGLTSARPVQFHHHVSGPISSTRVQRTARTFAASRSRRQAALCHLRGSDACLSGLPPVAARRNYSTGSRPVRSNRFASLRRHCVTAMAAFFVRQGTGVCCHRIAKDAVGAVVLPCSARRGSKPGAPFHFTRRYDCA